jgi:hypothetical protein
VTGDSHEDHIDATSPVGRRYEAAIEISDGDGAVVAVGRHVIAFLTPDAMPPEKENDDGR